MKKITGYICLVLSFAVWGVIALLPFIDISKSAVTTTTIFLIISGEVMFLISIALLGKEAWEHIKTIFKRSK